MEESNWMFCCFMDSFISFKSLHFFYFFREPARTQLFLPLYLSLSLSHWDQLSSGCRIIGCCCYSFLQFKNTMQHYIQFCILSILLERMTTNLWLRWLDIIAPTILYCIPTSCVCVCAYVFSSENMVYKNCRVGMKRSFRTINTEKSAGIYVMERTQNAYVKKVEQ